MNDASSINLENDPYFMNLRQSAEKRYIPIITPEVGQYLKVMIKAVNPAMILEIGTAIGYSTIWMALAAADNTEIVTLEIDEEKAIEARKHISHYGLEEKINLKIGDAVEILPYLRREFDFVFIDAAKGQYLNYLDPILELVPFGGIIIADNVLYRGYVKKKGKIKHKRRTMVNNLKEYIDIVSNHRLLETSIIPLGDGLAVSVVKK